MIDLVKRLRDYARDYTGTNYHDRLIQEAADRIEQLERDNAALREVLKEARQQLIAACDRNDFMSDRVAELIAKIDEAAK